MADLTLDLLASPVLSALPDAGREEQRLRSVLSTCDQLCFGPGPVVSASPDVLRFTGLPQSAVPAERYFLRCTQAQEVVFAASARLLQRVANELAFARIGSATFNLVLAADLFEVLLPRTFRLLHPLSPEDWQRLRPTIEQPSAIQGEHFRLVQSTLSVLHDNLAPHRVPSWEARHLPRYNEELVRVCRARQRWYQQHLAIVAHYSPSDSPGLTWLRARRLHTRACETCGCTGESRHGR